MKNPRYTTVSADTHKITRPVDNSAAPAKEPSFTLRFPTLSQTTQNTIDQINDNSNANIIQFQIPNEYATLSTHSGSPKRPRVPPDALSRIALSNARFLGCLIARSTRIADNFSIDITIMPRKTRHRAKEPLIGMISQ